jgi:8-oxo-dGTP pyrophosphatase MutT (NUDIX family)
MYFESFLKRLHANIGTQKPEAQQFMSPFKIGDRDKILKSNPNPRLGGVMILVYSKNKEAHITLIERPVYDGVHSGQIAFPGGANDPTDLNMQETALRELNEEIGINSNLVQVLGQISQVYIPPSKFLVTPFIGVLKQAPQFKKDDFEVKDIIEVPVSLLFDDSIIKSGKIAIGNNGQEITAPYFDIYGHKVWGATAIILGEFKAIMK